MNDRKTLSNLTASIAILMIACLIVPAPLLAAEIRGGTIWYVNHAAEGNEDGLSWENARTNLGSVLSQAANGDEVWVAQGLYTPGVGFSYSIPANVAVYGGFDGTEEERDQRDWIANVTILSGDADGDDLDEIATSPDDIVGDNSGPVVRSSQAQSGAETRLDGFTITAGVNANGAGMSVGNSSAIAIENVDFIGNFAGGQEGAGLDISSASPRLVNVRFQHNQAARGGAIRIQGGTSSPVMINVSLENNQADSAGGGIHVVESASATLINASFLGNHSGQVGGAINCDGCTLNIANGLLVGNTADWGGMLHNVVDGEVALTNVTAWGNTAIGSGGPGAIGHFDSHTTIYNSIFWNNGDNAINDFSNSVTASHSLIEDQSGGDSGNLDGTNPDNTPEVIQLPDLDNDDFGNLRMVETSPTIGQGSNALLPADEFDIDGDGNTAEPLPLDLGGNPRITDDTVDLGAYEFIIYIVTASVDGDGGTISPEQQEVIGNETASFTVMADAGWSVDEVSGDTCNPVHVGGNEWEATNITDDCVVTASFLANVYTVTANVSEGDGEITPSSQIVTHGETAIFEVTPDTDWVVDEVNGDTCNPDLVSGNDWEATNIQANCDVQASFVIDERIFVDRFENGAD